MLLNSPIVDPFNPMPTQLLVNFIKRPATCTRYFQRASSGPRPFSYRDGFALRLPFGRLLLVTRIGGKP